MKKKLLLIVTSLITMGANAQVKLGNNPTTINATAVLEIESTTKGFLSPRMTQAQRNAITSPAAGLQVWCSDCGISGELQTYNGTLWTNMIGGTAASPFVCGTSTITFTYNGASVTYGTVSRAYGGTVGTKCWLDRNLGATRVAANTFDAQSYGDLFQWGRGADGHQIRTSGVTSGTSSSTLPGTNFLSGSSNWFTGSESLWQGVNGLNNPCPVGFRLPTDTEWAAERTTWGGQYKDEEAIRSPLKLPNGASRNYTNGNLTVDFWNNQASLYWSSTVSNTVSYGLYFNSSGSSVPYNIDRATGASVRCIKN
jgi:uncharacterized protein (TIGR02145 family)